MIVFIVIVVVVVDDDAEVAVIAATPHCYWDAIERPVNSFGVDRVVMMAVVIVHPPYGHWTMDIPI